MAAGTPLWTVLAGLAGLAAGAGGRVLLGRLRRGALLSPPGCELLVAGTWAAAAGQAGRAAFPLWWLPIPLVVGWLAVLLSAVDLRHHRLPDALTLPAYPVLLGLLLLADGCGGGSGVGVRAVLGGLALGGMYAGVRLIAPRALGGGDVKLAGSLGAVLGAASWSALLLGPVLAAVGTLLLAAVRRRRTVPHGPGLLAAAWLLSTFPLAGAVAAG